MAELDQTADGKWAYTGNVGHFSTWNADYAYRSIRMRGCVQDRNGEPVKNAAVTARGMDYVGSSRATTDAEGRFEIRVRPESELELSATASGALYSDARKIRSERAEQSLATCLVVSGDEGIRDFQSRIKGATGSLEVCVRDHECEDGDEISVLVEGGTIFSGEIVNDWVCETLKVQSGKSYAVELTALNGTGYKGNCSYADANTGEIRVTGENTETQMWRHRGGAGSKARIIVEQKTMLIVRSVSGHVGFYVGEWTGPRNSNNMNMRDKACRRAKERTLKLGAKIVSNCECEFTKPYTGLQIVRSGWECYVRAKKTVVSEDDFWQPIKR